MHPPARPCLAVLLFSAAAIAAPAQTLITPTSATASSEYNSNYLIDYAIDGSGLPVDFDPLDQHAAYSGANHWTTSGSGSPADEFALFNFATPQSLTHFYLWNHLANTAPNELYYVTQFDLVFRDAESNVLHTESDLNATFQTAAQTFSFAEVANVSSVVFSIDSNAGNPQYTGLAEVRFGYLAIPEPATVGAWLAGTALVAALLRRRAAA